MYNYYLADFIHIERVKENMEESTYIYKPLKQG